MKLAVPLNVVLLAVAAGAVAFAVHGCNAARDARAEAEAAKALAAEQAKAVAAGVPVVQEVVPEQFQAFAAKLLAENADLQASLDRAEKAIPGVKVVTVYKAAVEGAVNSVPPVSPPPAGTAGAGAGASPSSASAPCVLFAGDKLRLELDAVSLQGPAKGHYLAGIMAAYRSADGALLLRQPFEGVNVQAEEAIPKPVKLPGWAFGLGAGISDHGALAAALLQTPPTHVPLLGWPLRGWAVVAGGASQGLVLGGASVEP